MLSGVLGRKLGSLVTGRRRRRRGLVVQRQRADRRRGRGVLALLVVGVLGIGALQRGMGRGTRRGGPIIWGGGGGGFGGGGGGGGGGGFGVGRRRRLRRRRRLGRLVR